MKNFSQIKKEAQRGDYGKVAKMAGCSRKNVELIVKEQRPDNYNVRYIFSHYLALKTEAERISRGIMKSTKRRVAA